MQNIIEITGSDKTLSTLVSIVKEAGLTEKLSIKGPFTIFAPTNAAFEKLPAGTIEGLVKPANKKRLLAILNYHVVAGNIHVEDLKNGQKMKTLNGKELHVRIKEGRVRLNQANLTTADIEASNGMVHVIDSVEIPSEVV